jgi:hypothetical protein
MADEEASVEVAEEEGHNQWSTDKEYLAANLLLLFLPAKALLRAMLLSSCRDSQLSLELDPTNSETNPAPAECRNPKPQTSPREHTKISRTDNTNALSAQMKYCPTLESGVARHVGLFYICRV